MGWMMEGTPTDILFQAFDDYIKAAPYAPLLTRCCDAEKIELDGARGRCDGLDDGGDSDGFRRPTITSRPRRMHRSLLGAATRRKLNMHGARGRCDGLDDGGDSDGYKVDDVIKAASYAPLLTRCCDAEKMIWTARGGVAMGWMMEGTPTGKLTTHSYKVDDYIKAAPPHRSLLGAVTRRTRDMHGAWGRCDGLDDGGDSDGFRRSTITSRPRRLYRSLLGATARRKRIMHGAWGRCDGLDDGGDSDGYKVDYYIKATPPHRSLLGVFETVDDDIKAASYAPLPTRCCDAEKRRYGRRVGTLRWVEDGGIATNVLEAG
ncbi:hypothetical protein B0H15DRAFT_950006 [Mycena belliarum]|uniref:Uncharacterized protein n=1 Tax=Mycena belliarum TaxID=1033014 RepID=A0AAD6U3B6_9AGAR|nr:hypothetical protein B0H15DRAFT_950006 [Mycena belliae]